MADSLFSVQDRRIVVAGAAGGIGAPLARELAARGAKLVLADRDLPRLSAATRDWPSKSQPERVQLDITDSASIDALLDTALTGLGSIDGVLNATGFIHLDAAATLPEDAFRRSLDVNVTGPFLLSRAAAARMSDGGSIVHLASVSSKVSNREYAAYASAKAGLSHLIRVLAREWAPRGITVNALGPAMIETPFVIDRLSDPQFREAALAMIPMRRFGTPQDLIGPALLLLSDAGRFITGQTLYVDGGRTLV